MLIYAPLLFFAYKGTIYNLAPCRLAVKWMPARGGMGASRPTNDIK